jgi:hypothetical protein
MPSNPGEETATAESDGSSNSSMIASPTEKKSNASRVKKRNVRGRGLRTSIKDLSLPEQEKARKFDLDGELDEAELAMMKYDVDGDGALTALEVHAIVEDLLRDRSSISAMRRIIAGLTCFVFILSLSNLGTSIASAILVKETTADTATAEMKIVPRPLRLSKLMWTRVELAVPWLSEVSSRILTVSIITVFLPRVGSSALDRRSVMLVM